ncbi:MAG: methylenetetrahydrofolate reductase [NAD(P)H] [Oscillospiraceae bacterium]|nr:methylenetetrahydrofolate reductase [NAD(P)H] [Oscillospiraceae bacterium]
MKAIKLFEKKPVLSFEVFPPKPNIPIESIYQTLDALKVLRPDFISVTYGAGGSVPGASTAEICETIQNQHDIPSIAHLPCINETKESVLEKLKIFRAKGVENILALRGDRNPNLPPKEDFRYASDLITFIREHGDFDIAAACYPEGHPEAHDLDTDILHLKEKVDAGASHLISQLFYHNADYYAFQEKIAKAGITVPVEAGIMPVTSKKSIERMVSLCGASIPKRLAKLMARYADDPASLKAAGLEYAIMQILELLDNGVDGIHIYTMNNPDVARYIMEQISEEPRI